MKFNVCVLPTSVHTAAFSEMAESIAWSLRELGHEVTESRHLVYRDDVRNIVFGLRPGDGAMLAAAPSSILYNGEQVSKDSLWSQLVDVYRGFTVWDYSAANAERYADWGLPKPTVVRPGDCPLLSERILLAETIYDVCFFGSMNPRRHALLERLRAQGMTVDVIPLGVYGEERNQRIAQSRVVVNVHFYESPIFEALRCSPLLQSGRQVVTESSEAREEEIYGLTGVSYEDLPQAVQQALHLPSEAPRAPRPQALHEVSAAVASLKPTPLRATSSETPPLTLSMIVKNEARIIERCLWSVKPWIKQWTIVDTGSTDGTQDLIRATLGDLPGQVHDLSWKEFDGSRNDALDLARQQCGEQGWLLLLDADEILRIDGELQLSEQFDCYNGWVSRCLTCVRWARPVIAKANRPWFYEMPRHEGLYCRMDAPTAPLPLENLMLLSLPDGGRSEENAYDKFMRDAKVLERWLPSHPGHSRCQYYIAQSYRDAAQARSPVDRPAMLQAVAHYLRRAEMPGFDQETFSAIYQAASCMHQAGFPAERVVLQLLRAYNYRPTRAEPLHALANHFAGSEQWSLAELFARQAMRIPVPIDHFADCDRNVYAWQAQDELAKALIGLGKHEEALLMQAQLLGVAGISPIERQRLRHSVDELAQKLGK